MAIHAHNIFMEKLLVPLPDGDLVNHDFRKEMRKERQALYGDAFKRAKYALQIVKLERELMHVQHMAARYSAQPCDTKMQGAVYNRQFDEVVNAVDAMMQVPATSFEELRFKQAHRDYGCGPEGNAEWERLIEADRVALEITRLSKGKQEMAA